MSDNKTLMSPEERFLKLTERLNQLLYDKHGDATSLFLFASDGSAYTIEIIGSTMVSSEGDMVWPHDDNGNKVIPFDLQEDAAILTMIEEIKRRRSELEKATDVLYARLNELCYERNKK